MALILIFLPGLIAALLLRVPWPAALAVSPGLSTTALVLITVTSSAVGVPWGPVPLIAGIGTIWLLAGALSLLIRRKLPPDSHAGSAEPNRLPISMIAATAIAAVGVALVLLPVSGTPEAFPQNPDTMFHLGVSQWMLEHSDASFLNAEAFRGSSGSYQAAFHAMVATISQLTGASVVVSTSSFVLVIAGVVWPLGCIFLARTLFGAHLAVTLSAGAASVAFSAYPFLLMGYGVLWPNLFGQALVPGALALLAVIVSATGREYPPPTDRLRAILLLLATLPGLVVAHPNGFLAFVMFGYLMVSGLLLGKAWEMRLHSPRRAAASVAGLVTATAVAYFATTGVNLKPGMRLQTSGPGPEISRLAALRDVLLFAPREAKDLWVLAVVVALGAGIVLVRHRGRRWLVAALIITSALVYLNVAVDNLTVRLFTWPWNNQVVRLAAMVVLPAVLLATAALSAGAQFLQTRWDKHGSVRLRPWASAVAVPLVFVVLTGGAYVGSHRDLLNPYFHPTGPRSWVTRSELVALQSLALRVPKDAVVAENPWKGGSYMYVVSGRRMLFPTEKDLVDSDLFPNETDPLVTDRMLLALSLDVVGTSPKVCAAARRQHVEFAITGGRSQNSASGRNWDYQGIDAVRKSGSFRKVAKKGPYTLYRMIKCARG